jgi:hypothetical protein
MIGPSAVVVASQLDVSNNQTNGFDVYGTLVLGRSMITGNDGGVIIRAGGSVYSYRNNEINGNRSDVAGGAISSTYSLQ